MSVRNALMGLLVPGPRHGYDLKQLYDETLSPDRPLPAGQVYSTLGRLERDELVALAAVVEGDGPDRKLYELTDTGMVTFTDWLARPEVPEPQLQSTLYTKVVLTLVAGGSIDELFDTQRTAHLSRMRELTALRREAGPTVALMADYALFHLEADLRWLELTAARVDEIGRSLPAALDRSAT